MRTPCQDEPELWVSDLPESRREAARACKGCPAFAWCTKEAARVKPTHGIWHGRDYSKIDALNEPTKTCAECDTDFTRSPGANNDSWNKRQFCSRKCAARARNPIHEQPTKTCVKCATTFARSYHSDQQWDGAKFCSVECAGKSRRAA